VIPLNQSDFVQFNINSKLNLIKRDGKLIATKFSELKIYSYYKLYGFYVEVVFDEAQNDVVGIYQNINLNKYLFSQSKSA